ncbi:Polycystic kidney disease protein 1-like 3 [Actinoplanes sp. SE50]|uniref:Polycystic kidney disease protein 1-like 3 n=1 Tax=unclassified Actinoplanes TaxID=2626549 RepID=UPI00023EBF9C|nr:MULTISPECIES: Polycystic kidney disease protein 1-like 3 [unclassified Actinoplanes]AEV86922.1 Polycystic kidney disease protein 1-like 3 [Actinoplanes sp. SE50/110]ATO85318.1 Polycystic kidney disease protein 1-like 3 [Actinoplanes sp. SE50]SLM02729.1 uncharacterized protein ACSP50_6014 [Actinoplanes sp. SE50/110]
MRNAFAARVLPALLIAGLAGCSTGTTAAGSPATSPVASSPVSTPGSTPASPAGSPAVTSAAVPAAPSTAVADAAAFPVVITRTGGIAGVDDRVSIDADGAATVTRRGQKARHVTVPPAMMTGLRRALAAPMPRGAAVPPAGACSDGFVYQITRPAGSVTVADCGKPADPGVTAILDVAKALLAG